jgi:hypothetical protein
VGQNQNSHNALLRAGFNVGDVVEIRRVMEKIQLQYIWVYFFYFWCVHADGRIAIGSGQPMEEVLNDTAYAIHCKAIVNTFTEELSPSDSAHLIPQREEAGPDLSKYSVGSSPH